MPSPPVISTLQPPQGCQAPHSAAECPPPAAATVGVGAVCGIAQIAGRKQEDRCSVRALEDSVLAAVFDGHGGTECAEWLSAHLPALLTTTPTSPSDAAESLSRAFLSADDALKRAGVASTCGSTSLVALVLQDTVVCANCGKLVWQQWSVPPIPVTEISPGAK